MFLHYTSGAFTKPALDSLAQRLMYDSEELEKIPATPFNLSTNWIYTHEYPTSAMYHSGKTGGGKHFITLEINVITGGYSATTKTEFIKRATDAIAEFGGLPKGEPRRVYVVMREVAEANWGFDGKTINLEELRGSTDESITPL
jgi:phenylpyruvate tautomerase PptA (4-oxalocrotonate tautomerase family)